MTNSIYFDDPNILDLWEAYASPTERICISQAAGRIAASTIRQYPPGIPEVIPGMIYSEDTISNLTSAFHAGADVIGVDFESGGFIDVLTEIPKSNLVKNFKIKTTYAENVSEETCVEIADFFRAGFCTAPYFHFAFHKDDPLRALPATLDYAAWAQSLSIVNKTERGLVQERLLSLALSTEGQKKNEDLVNSIHLPEGFHQWTNKTTCRLLMRDRLQDPGYVTLVRDKRTNDIVGLLHARMGTLERLFYSEEWHDPLIFSGLKHVELLDHPENFYKKMKFHFGLNPSTRLMTISAQLLDPKVRGGEMFYLMMRDMAKMVSPIHASLPILCEIPSEGTAHILNVAINERLVFGALKNGHPVVFCHKKSAALFPFIAEKSHWRQILKAAAKSERQFNRQHFVASKSDCPDVNVILNGGMGLAVFATDKIKSGTRIAIFEGETYEAEHALALPVEMRDHAVQTGPKTYVFGYKGLAHCLCHSCDPNCGIRNLTEIFTARDIEKGEQLTWDYRCTENSTWVLEKCLCGSKRCTGIVRNYDSLLPTIKKEYQSKNMLSEWLLKE